MDGQLDEYNSEQSTRAAKKNLAIFSHFLTTENSFAFLTKTKEPRGNLDLLACLFLPQKTTIYRQIDYLETVWSVNIILSKAI